MSYLSAARTPFSPFPPHNPTDYFLNTPDLTLDSYILNASDHYLSRPPPTTTQASLLSHIRDTAPIRSLGYRLSSIHSRAAVLLSNGTLGPIASALPATPEELLQLLLSGRSSSNPVLTSAVDEAEITLPADVQLTLLSPLLAAIETSAFEFVRKHYPEILQERGWGAPNAVKATEWLRALAIEVPRELEGVEEAVLSKGRIRMRNDTVLAGLEAAEEVIGGYFGDRVLEMRVKDVREDLKRGLGELRRRVEGMRRGTEEDVKGVLRNGVEELGGGLKGWAGVEGREYPSEDEEEGDGDDGEGGEDGDEDMDDADDDDDEELDDEDEEEEEEEKEEEEEEEEEKNLAGTPSVPQVRREMDSLRVNPAKRPRHDWSFVKNQEYPEYDLKFPEYAVDTIDEVRIKRERSDSPSQNTSVTIKK